MRKPFGLFVRLKTKIKIQLVDLQKKHHMRTPMSELFGNFRTRDMTWKAGNWLQLQNTKISNNCIQKELNQTNEATFSQDHINGNVFYFSSTHPTNFKTKQFFKVCKATQKYFKLVIGLALQEFHWLFAKKKKILEHFEKHFYIINK